MKRIGDLEQAELVALDDETIQRYIDLEIAHAGVMPVLAPAPLQLEDVSIEANEVAFEVSGVLVRTIKEAEILSKMNLLTTDYNFKASYDHRWLKPLTGVTITEKKFYDEADVNRVADLLGEQNRKQTEYDTGRREYDKFVRETIEIRNNVRATVNAACTIAREIETAKATYAKHLDLANGDELVGARFFRDAYRDRTDLIEAVLGADEVAQHRLLGRKETRTT